MQPERVGRDRDQHGAHAEIEPTGLAQHGHAGVHHGPAGAARHQRRQVLGIDLVLAQAVVAPVQVVGLQRRLALEFLDEVAVPVQPAQKGLQPLAMRAAVGRIAHGAAGGLHHLAQAQAAIGQIGRQTRAGAGRGQGRGHAAPVAAGPTVGKAGQALLGQSAATALAGRGIGRVQAQGGRARPGQGLKRQDTAACRQVHGLQVRGGGPAGQGHVGLPRGGPALALAQAAYHAKASPFAPGHALGAAPARHRKVTGVGPAVAGFLVGMHGCKRGRGVQTIEHLHHVALRQHQLAAQRPQGPVQVAQRLAHKAQVLGRHVGLLPQARLDHIQAQHRPAPRCLEQGRVVVHAQIALEPDEGVGHGGVRGTGKAVDFARAPMSGWALGPCAGRSPDVIQQRVACLA